MGTLAGHAAHKANPRSAGLGHSFYINTTPRRAGQAAHPRLETTIIAGDWKE